MDWHGMIPHGAGRQATFPTESFNRQRTERVSTMRRSRALVLSLVALLLAAQIAHARTTLPGIGKTLVLQGFAATLVSVMRAHEAGAADYVAGRGNIFLLVTVQVKRQGSHDSFIADPADFHIQTSSGAAIDSEEFGMTKELTAHHVYTKPQAGVIGFEVPASDKGLLLLWQPSFPSNPDAQATWSIGAAGKTVQYYQ
jgi:hypothetical protein